MEDIHSYAAGIFDGEGTVTLTKRTNTKLRFPIVSVANTEKEILIFLQVHYGGQITEKKVYSEKHTRSFVWRLASRQAIEFLSVIFPYMVSPKKRYRTNLVLKHYLSLTPRNGKYTDDMITKKIEFQYLFFHPSDTISDLT